MPRRSLEEQLTQISARQAQLDARRKTLQARLGKQERARDTRRKVLLGALLLHRLENGNDEMAQRLGHWLRRELPGFLKRPDDKALFDDLLASPTERPAPSVATTTHDAHA